MLHTTYVYGQQAGKRTRLREAGLWLADAPSYFRGPFLALDIDLPEVNIAPCAPATVQHDSGAAAAERL